MVNKEDLIAYGHKGFIVIKHNWDYSVAINNKVHFYKTIKATEKAIDDHLFKLKVENLINED